MRDIEARVTEDFSATKVYFITFYSIFALLKVFFSRIWKLKIDYDDMLVCDTQKVIRKVISNTVLVDSEHTMD